MDERVRQAALLFEQAIFGGDAGALDGADRGLDAAEAELAIVRGKLMHARFLLLRDEAPDELPCFERAAQLSHALGDARGEAEALFWVGCFHQVVRRDNAAAEPVLERSLELAREAGDTSTAAEALRHLGIAAHRAGDLDAARQRLTESTQLRRGSGHLPGVASNLIGLAYIAGAQGRPEDARAHLAEASAIARDHGAQRLLHTIAEAQAELFTMPGRSLPWHDEAMPGWRFGAHIAAGPRGHGVIAIPFDPDESWGAKAFHPVGGTVNGRLVRGTITPGNGGWTFQLTPMWMRDTGVAVGDDVVVELAPEGPQRGDLADDIAAALEASPAAAAFWDTLAQFYRKAYLRWIDGTTRRPELRAQRIAEVVDLLAAGIKQRPRP